MEFDSPGKREKEETKEMDDVEEVNQVDFEVEIDVEFSPVEHPVEPDHEDRPVKCPVPVSSSPLIHEEKRREIREEKRKDQTNVAQQRTVRVVRKRQHHTFTGGNDVIMSPMNPA